MLLKILKSKKTASRTLIAVGGGNMQECQVSAYKTHPRKRVSMQEYRRQKTSRGGSSCKNIASKKTQPLFQEVGQHAGIVGQHKQERWVNMGRNLQSVTGSICWKVLPKPKYWSAALSTSGNRKSFNHWRVPLSG